MIRFVTSMSRAQFDAYGMNMLKSFQLPVDSELRVYSEDDLPIPHYPLYPDSEMGASIKQIMAYYGKLGVLRGQSNGLYFYQRNLWGFAHKVFAQIQGALDFPGQLFWVDADTLWESQKPLDWYRNCLAGHAMCVMARRDWHLCSSFIGWNMTHPKVSEFFETYLGSYMSGAVLTFPQWDDAGVTNYLIARLEIPYNDISPKDLDAGPVNVFDAVFHSVAKHMKGALKGALQGDQGADKELITQSRGGRYAEILAEVAKRKPKRILEIGTWDGEFGIAMCKAAGGAEYVGFDLFEDATDETDAEEKNVKRHVPILEVSQRFVEAGVKAELYKGNTRETLDQYLCTILEPFDFAFIDGGHSIETISSDFGYVLQFIGDNGLIVLDDYYEGGIDTSLYGCNTAVAYYKGRLSESSDPVKGGGVVRCFFHEVVRCFFNGFSE